MSDRRNDIEWVHAIGYNPLVWDSVLAVMDEQTEYFLNDCK